MKHITSEERHTIAHLLGQGQSINTIARQLSRAPSTISRELKRNRDMRNGDYTTRLALMEEMKTFPSGAVWDEYCARQEVPVCPSWMEEVKSYEKSVLSKR